MTQIIGYIAAVFTTLSSLPQIIHIFRTKDTSGISLLMWIQVWAGIALWAIYGFMTKSGPVLIANITAFVLTTTIIVAVVRLRYIAGQKII